MCMGVYILLLIFLIMDFFSIRSLNAYGGLLVLFIKIITLFCVIFLTLISPCYITAILFINNFTKYSSLYFSLSIVFAFGYVPDK